MNLIEYGMPFVYIIFAFDTFHLRGQTKYIKNVNILSIQTFHVKQTWYTFVYIKYIELTIVLKFQTCYNTYGLYIKTWFK